jgi:hypothetical protein
MLLTMLLQTKIDDVLRYFESNYGRWFDSDADGVLDSYQYNSQATQCDSLTLPEQSECVTGSYSIWATANLLLGMLYPDNDLNYLRRLFHPASAPEQVQGTKEETELLKSMPSMSLARITEVEYPHVMVSYAQVTLLHDTKSVTIEEKNGSMKQRYNLSSILRPGDNAPIDRTHHITITNIPCETAVSMTVSVDEEVVSKYMIHHDTQDAKMCYIPLTVHGWTKESIENNDSIRIEVLY